jgi:1,2-diacylglycerol 3-alpha-glucosyltransferase
VSAHGRLRIALPCSGLGRTLRGYERFTEELARALQPLARVWTFAGRLPRGLTGSSLPCAPRDWLTRLGVNPPRAYYLEQATFAAALGPALVACQADVVHISDPALANAFLKMRPFLPRRPTLVFCNGGNISPEHWRRYDHVQLVAPWQAEEAAALGIDAHRYSVLPLGTQCARFYRQVPRAQARAALGLGLGEGPLALSVASLDASVKRLDYVIEELARPEARDWRLVCLGQRTPETPALEALARRLAPGRVAFRSVAPDEVPSYLWAADAFVLASHNEGFGLAALEAMAAGVALRVRDLPSLRYIVGDPEQHRPLTEPGALAAWLAESSPANLHAQGEANVARADALDWSRLAPAYLELYARARRGGAA